MPDFAYTVGIDVDSSGLDSFIQRARSLATSINFGGATNIPSGVSAAGPGITQGPAGAVANFTSGPQAVAFANAMRQGLAADLAQAKASGRLSGEDYKAAKRATDAIGNALEAGARKFSQVLAAVKGPVTPERIADAGREAQRVIDSSLDESEKREAKNARRREAAAAKRAADRAEQGASDADADAKARREATAAHRREAQAAGKSATTSERLADEGAKHDAQKNLEKRRARDAARREAEAEERNALEAINDRATETREAREELDRALRGDDRNGLLGPPTPGPQDPIDMQRDLAQRLGRAVDDSYERFTASEGLFSRPQGVSNGELARERFLIAAQANAQIQSAMEQRAKSGADWDTNLDTADIEERLGDLGGLVDVIEQDFREMGIESEEFNDALRIATAHLRRYGANHPDLPPLEDPLQRRVDIERMMREAGTPEWEPTGRFEDVTDLDDRRTVPSQRQFEEARAAEEEAAARVRPLIDQYRNQEIGFRDLLNRGFRGADADPASGRMAEADEALAAQKTRAVFETYDRGVITVSEMHLRLEEINEELRQQQAAAAEGAEAQQRGAAAAAEGARLQDDINDKRRAAGGRLSNLPQVPDDQRAAAAAGGGGDSPPFPPKRRIPPGGGGGDDGGGGPPPTPPPDDDDPESNKDKIVSQEIRKAKEDELSSLKRRLRSLREQTTTDEQIARVKAEILLAERQQARREREQNQAVFAQARSEGFFNVGTPVQRIQAAIKSRDGNLVDPLGEKRGGALLATRAFQASSFAVGGLAFYGALQVIRDTLEESEKLERQFAVVRGQIDRTFGDQSSVMFERFKEQVRSISLETGQLGSEVALVARQLQAAFVDQDASPEVKVEQFDRAGRNALAAFKFSEVTGLDSKEMTDSLTALGLSFGELNEDFRPLLDNVIAMEEKFGVLGGQIITFAADLAPLAANAGFSAESLTELGAVAQKFSGRAGGALAEQFGRILTDLPDKAPDLVGIFEGTPQLADLSKGLADAFVADNMEEVLEFILTASARVKDQKLNPGIIQEISESVAGRREGASFAAILRQPRELLEALQTEGADNVGALDERFARVRDSLSETMERMRRSVEQLAEAILSAGLADAIKFIATGLGAMASAAATVIRFFDRLNDATGGVAGQLLGLLAIVKTVDAALRLMATSNVIGALIGTGAQGAIKGVAGRGVGSLLRSGVGAAASGIGGAWGAARLGGMIGLRQAAVTGLAGLGGALAGGTSTLAYWGGSGAVLGRTLLPSLGAGGAGAVAAGIAAPVGAAVATVQLTQAIGDVRGMVKDAGNALRLQVQGADFKGILSALQVPDTDTRILGIPGTQSVGRIALGGASKLPENIVREVGVETIGLTGLQGAFNALNPETDLTDSGRERYAEAYLELEKAARGEEADLVSVLEFFGDVGENRADLVEAMDDGVAKAKEAEAAVAEINQGTSGPQFQALLQALQAGRATPEEVRGALEAAIAPMRTLAASALEAGDYTAYLAQLEQIAQAKAAADQGISQYVASTINFSERIRDIFGDSDPQTRILTAAAILQNPQVTDPETRLAALESLEAARKEAFQKRLDHARNEEERLRILEEGPGVDPLARAEAIYLQINQGIERKIAQLRSSHFQGKKLSESELGRALGVPAADFTDDIERLEGITRENIEEISDQLIEDIEMYGSGAVRIRIELLKKRRAELFALLRSLGPGTAGRAVRGDIAAIDSQIDTYLAIDQSGVDPSALVVDDGSADQPSPEEIARKRREVERDRRLAEIARARAAANGDPVREAALAKEAAAVSRNFAIEEFGAGSIEAINAQAEYINAQNAQNDAFADIAAAQLELAAAYASKNPLQVAQIAIQQADLAIRQARGTAERLRAEAQRQQAGEALADVIRDIADAQYEYLIAVAESNGDQIEAIEVRKKQIQDGINLARQNGDISGAIRGEGDLVTATRQGYDAALDKQRQDIDFALQMEQISKQQAIASYRMLLEIPTNTEAQNRELQLAIKGLQDELGQNYQFNLPSNLNLPTLYEARRLDQSGGSGYQDNRTINVNFTANNTADAQAIANTIVEQFGRPTRFGTAGRPF